MDPRTESIKQEVEETLEDMAEKMEQIESRVYGAARETVQNVKEKFDVRHLTAEHPWRMLGASVAVGFVVGNIRRSESRRQRRLAAESAGEDFELGQRFSYEHSDDPYAQSEDESYGMAEMVHVGQQGFGAESSGYGRGEESSGYGRGMIGAGGMGRQHGHHPARDAVRRGVSRVSHRVKESAPSIFASLKEHFGDEIEALKKATLITAGNSLRGLIQRSLPQLAQEFDRVRQGAGNGHGHEQHGGGWQQSQQRAQGGSQGQGESRYGGSQYGSEGRYGSGNQYGGEHQGQSERYGAQGQGRSGSQGQGGYGAQGQGQGRYGNQGQQGQQGERYGNQGQQGQQGQGRYGSQGQQGETRYGSQQGQTRGYNPDSPNVGSSVDNEYGNRDNEGGGSGYGSGYPGGRKGHN